ncbi:MAG: dTDP-glucose 4,6-dehydratase [Bacilli bacterium]|nr:dTDP-glucose 4,6-dehydratase [Bacilli bacterium]
MMKLLVTGGAGFIGSNFLEYMLNKYKNYSFVCIDSLVYKQNEKNLVNIMNYSNFKFIKGDITDKTLIDNLFEKEKFDCVVNFAAEIAVDYSIENPNVFIQTNVIGTAILMNACLKYGVKRFHQISTDEVYGDLPLDSRKSFTEQAILKPSNPYSASKAAADMLVLSYYRTYGLNVTISRCTNNYGPHQSDRALIPLVIKRALNNEPISVFGSGQNVRDWIYVYDHVTAIDLILHKGVIGEIYNVSGQSKKKNIDVIKRILKLVNGNESLICYTEDRPGHDLKYSINSKKIEQQLKWDRKYDFNKGIHETINWFLKNR